MKLIMYWNSEQHNAKMNKNDYYKHNMSFSLSTTSHLFVNNLCLKTVECRDRKDFNQSIELQNKMYSSCLTVLDSSSSSLILRWRRTRIRRGTLWTPLLQTYLLTVGSILTSSVHIAFWANLRIESMQRGALLLKALQKVSIYYSVYKEIKRIHTKTYTLWLHFPRLIV